MDMVCSYLNMNIVHMYLHTITNINYEYDDI